MTNLSQGPPRPPVDRNRAQQKAQADLRQAVWEMSQFASRAEIATYVGRVLNEIESDEG